jgi:hypothetical protein
LPVIGFLDSRPPEAMASRQCNEPFPIAKSWRRE